MPDHTREIADLRQTEAWLLMHGIRLLSSMATTGNRAAYNLTMRIWMHVKERRESLELEARRDG